MSLNARELQLPTRNPLSHQSRSRSCLYLYLSWVLTRLVHDVAPCRKECPRARFQTVGYKTRAPLSVGGSSSNYLPIRHPTKKCAGFAAGRAFTLAINAENIMLLNVAPRNNLDTSSTAFQVTFS